MISDRTDSPYTVLPGRATALAVSVLSARGGGDRSSSDLQSCSDLKAVMGGANGEDDLFSGGENSGESQTERGSIQNWTLKRS